MKGLLRGAGADIIARLARRANQVSGAQIHLPILVNAANNRLDEPVTEAALVKHRNDEGSQCLATDVALLLQFVHVSAILQMLRKRKLVGAEASNADNATVVDNRELWHLHGEGLDVLSEAIIAGNGKALLASHRNAASTIELKNRHLFY